MKLETIRFDDLYDPEKVITSSEFHDKKKFNDDGLFSERIFGEYSDNSGIDTIGWIDFSPYKIISPIFYERLKKVLKTPILDKILKFNYKTNESGSLVPEDEKKKEIEFQSVGIPGFIEHFEEIMELYAKTDVPEYAIVMKAYKEDKIFISKFPVFSSKLRPGILFAGTKSSKPVFKYDDISVHYNFIVKYSNEIKELVGDDNDEDKKLALYPMLFRMQESANLVATTIIKNFLRSKKGVFRKLIASTRVNYSSRNVLTPMINADINSVSLPYLTFLELYKFVLINIIVKTEGITFNDAERYWYTCKFHFDSKMYKYMNQIIKYGHPVILLNRNPSINIGSILQLNVGSVKEDYSDLTLSVPNSILVSLNGDYDGDVLNIIALLTASQKEMFKNLSPSSLIISKNNAKFNRDFALAKDSRCGYHILNSTD